jgi:hypothetical protein
MESLVAWLIKNLTLAMGGTYKMASSVYFRIFKQVLQITCP